MSKTLRSAFVGAATSLALIFTGAPAQAADIPAVTDDYLFTKTLSQFKTIRTQAPYSGQLDWSSDGCSYSPDNPFGFKFLPACHRHDFGYRNYKRQSRFTETTQAAHRQQVQVRHVLPVRRQLGLQAHGRRLLQGRP